MKSFASFDGTRIAYKQWGEGGSGPWVVLHHGFMADAHTNWVAPGVVDALVGAGRRVVALDARSHGRSDKPHEAERCGELNMCRDLQRLFDELGDDRFDLVGYSMGAVVSLITATQERRVRRLVAGGVGEGILVCGGVDTRVLNQAALLAALRAEDPTTVRDPMARGFRAFADALRADRQGLIAHCQSIHQSPIALANINVPTLVVAGDDDVLAARPHLLAEAIPGAKLVRVHGNHEGAVIRPEFQRAIVDFLT